MLMNSTCLAGPKEETILDVLRASESGNFVLTLPPLLKDYECELQGLLNKVFSGRPSSPENLALAQQLSLNWCFSKIRQKGLSLDECFVE